ncbi:MAG: hypothetical protein GF355_15930 [Candidatus Eisenbacteria bacterium]|nr:hypothetical protein [Candidatus Eisenbacteria bacterium]
MSGRRLHRPARLLEAWDDRPAWLWGLVALGILLRLAQYLANPSLWLDEAMLALNLVARSAAQLQQPLDYEQAAPLLFLQIEKLLLNAFGTKEPALRALPLLSGCAALVLSRSLMVRLLPRGARAAALFLVAVSNPLIDYATQVKPYALDAALAVLALALAARLVLGRGRQGSLILLALTGLLAPWISFGAAFALAPAYALLIVHFARRRMWGLLRMTAGGGLVWLVSSLGLGIMMSGWESVGALQKVWSSSAGFAPFPPESGPDLLWYARSAYRVARHPGGFLIPPVGLALWLWGAVWLARRPRGGTALWLLLGPALLALAASMLKAYPFAGRLLLFAAPGLAALAGAGLYAAASWADGPGRLRPALAAILMAVSLGVEGARAGYHLVRPRVREEVREMTAILRRRTRPGDVAYVYYGAKPTFDFYMPDPPIEIHSGVKARREPGLYREDLRTLDGRPRVWVLLSHVYTWGAHDEGRLILEELDRLGRQRRAYPQRDGGLYLYDLGPR